MNHFNFPVKTRLQTVSIMAGLIANASEKMPRPVGALTFCSIL